MHMAKATCKLGMSSWFCVNALDLLHVIKPMKEESVGHTKQQRGPLQ